MIVGINNFNDSQLDNGHLNCIAYRRGVSSSIYIHSITLSRVEDHRVISKTIGGERWGELLAAMSLHAPLVKALPVNLTASAHCMSTLPNPYLPANARVTPRTVRIIICEGTPAARSFLAK